MVSFQQRCSLGINAQAGTAFDLDGDGSEHLFIEIDARLASGKKCLAMNACREGRIRSKTTLRTQVIHLQY